MDLINTCDATPIATVHRLLASLESPSWYCGLEKQHIIIFLANHGPMIPSGVVILTIVPLILEGQLKNFTFFSFLRFRRCHFDFL
jgi:hypothetical protein